MNKIYFSKIKLILISILLMCNINMFSQTTDKLKVSVSPNPTSNYIIISGLTEVENYKIYNILGKEVLNGLTSNKEKIDVSHLIKGLYLIKIGNKKTIKIIKK